MFTEERARWLYEHYRWLEDTLPARSAGKPRVLIQPTKQFFPMRHTADEGFAAAVFARTKDLMDVSEWACRLTQQTEEERERESAFRAAGLVADFSHSGAAGTFQAAEEVEITYAPNLLKDPIGLVATLAHELCHYLLATVETEPPAGWEELEPLTDLAAVVEGFGVFLCNSAFSFGPWSEGLHQGWQSSTRGYLNTAELGFALGVFCVRTGTPPERASQFLKPNPREVFLDSIDYIAALENPG